MVYGILAGLFWAIETVVIGVVLQNSTFVSTKEAILIAPFVSTFFHDMFSSFIMHIINLVKGKYKKAIQSLKTRSVKYLILASLIGGPIGMCGYFLDINYLGPSIGALSSAIYPAIGALLAYLFLKEDMPWYRWIFLIVTIGGVFMLSYSPDLNVTNFWLGLVGAFMCAFGWGIEGVILSKCMKDNIKDEYCLMIRQTVSFITIGVIILPILKGYQFIATIKDINIYLLILVASLFATISYLCYYKAIYKIGVSKAMSLNITYVAYSTIFTIIFLKDYSLLNPFNIVLILVVLVSALLSTYDFKKKEI